MKKMIWLTTFLLVATWLVVACNRGQVISTTSPSKTAPFIWTSESRCADCHTSEVNSMTDTTLLASKHAAGGNSCLDCHEAADMQAAHENIKAVTTNGPVPKYPRSLCLKCHGSYADIIKLTKGRTRLNPHDSHYGEVDCFICHKVHSAKSPYALCISCHITMN